MLVHILPSVKRPRDFCPADQYSLKAACARVLERTGREMSAHKKIWSAHKCSFKKCFRTYFMRVALN